MATTLPVNIHFSIGLHVYGNGVPIQQPKKVNSYPQPGGKSLGGSPNGGSPRKGSLN
jgi:hypothetical protein